MILSGSEIKAQLGGNIKIEPWSDDQLNPNSYNLTLHDELLVYEEIVLDMKRPSRFRRITIPEEGLILQPNQLYLARTIEHTETHNFVPMLEGRSSIGRLGLFVHVTAGFGDVGFSGYWTLEMFAVQPVRIYPGVQVCQIFYHTLSGDVTEYKSSKYQHNTDIQPSLLFRELGVREDNQMKLKFSEDGTPETESADQMTDPADGQVTNP
ncbi:MAG TPA: dCTP deaminase [Planctomycetaceae bacterium]|nr:dCTP deaminase [Planctomycetaceae bacterium]